MGKHTLIVTYPGGGTITGATTTVELVVKKRLPVVATKLIKKPTPLASGRVKVTVASPLATKPTGRVTLTLTKSGKTRTVTGTLRQGTARLTLPLLSPGAWRAVTVYTGDARYADASSKPTEVVCPK